MYDICALVVSDLGGADHLTEARISLIRRFASLCVLSEDLDARIADGEEIDISRYSKMSSTLVRLATRIGLKRVPKNVTPHLHDYLEAASNEQTDEVAP
jgi:hypothetical protein